MRDGRVADPLGVVLDGRGCSDADVGSKAASLDRLIGAGFRVPETAVVTTAAYRAFVAGSGLNVLIKEISSRPLPPAALGEDRRREIDEAFISAPMPDEVFDALSRIHGELPPGRELAVRSSAEAEDLEDASFAGQYLSVLGVEGFDEMVEAVRRVWASLWYPWASAYRQRMNVVESDLAMAVIIQRLVPAQRSGVVFTRDPNEPGLLRLEVVDGLGEQLVSGEVTPEVHQLRRPGLQPVAAAMIDAALREAAHTALRIEERFGAPQDVEWSVAADGVWVLQARPITTLAAAAQGDGFDTDGVRTDRYVAAGVTEMLPGVIPPLLWTMNGPMVEDAFRSLFHRLRVLPPDLRGAFGFVARRRGRARLNITAMQRTTEGLAGWSPAEVERLYLGNEVEDDAAQRGSRLRSMAVSARAFRLRGRAPREAEAFVAAVPAIMGRAVDPTRLLDSELIAYRWRIRDLAASGMRAEVTVAAIAVSAYRALETLLEGWVGEDGPVWAQRLTRHAGRNADTPVARAVARLAAMAPADREAILDVLRSTSGDPRPALAGQGDVGAAFVAGVDEDLRHAGSAAIYGGATWEEQAEYLWSTFGGVLPVAAAAEQGSAAEAAADLAKLEDEVTASAKWRFVRIVTGQVVDMRIRFLRRLVADTVSALSWREHAKQALLVLGGEERRVIREMAERLVRRGVLDDPESIQLLADWELDELMSGGLGPPSMELRRRGKVLRRWRSEPAAPVAQAAPRTGETLLHGWGASPGVYRGPVRVVLDPIAAGDVEEGMVLVAPATDPSWVPLLLKAGALIVERGGPLSHAAIVAREFGLPAVLNISAATSQLAGVAHVQVDGTAGEVLVLRESEAGGPSPQEVPR